jgi:hypothetical protein
MRLAAPLMSASNRGTRRNTSTHSCSKACGGEFVCVAIALDLDPMIVDSLIQSSLEIGIPHIHEVIASQYAADNNFMLDENADDLAPYVFIRCHFVGPL